MDRASDEDTGILSLAAAAMLVEMLTPRSIPELRAAIGRSVAAEAEYTVSAGMLTIVEASSRLKEGVPVLISPIPTLVEVASKDANDVIADGGTSESKLDTGLLGKAVVSLLRIVSVVESISVDISD